MAWKRLAASRVSNMDASSTITKSALSGFDSLTVKEPSEGSNFNKRWMVCPKAPVVSDKRWAARPVGAARSTRTFFALRILTTARRIVVFPVPGPPVNIESL